MCAHGIILAFVPVVPEKWSSVREKLNSIPNRFVFALYVALVLLGGALLFNSFIGYRAGAWSASSMAAPAALLAVALALFVRLALQWRSLPERIFLVTATPALVGFALFILPDHIPDEVWHIYRIFSIEDPGSHMVVPSPLLQSALPTDYTELYAALTGAYSWSDTMVVGRDMSSYLTHLYLVPGIVVKLCMLANVNPFVTIYVARLVNATLFAVGGYWIIKTMPLARVCMCVYLLNPMLIQQEASCSADAVTNIITLLFIAYLMRVRFQDAVTRRDIVVLVVLFVVTALSKYAYALLVFLFLLLVPKIERKRTRTAIYAGTAVVFAAGLLFVVFFASSASYQTTLDLIRNPPELAAVLAKTFYEVGPVWVMQFAGFSLSNLDVSPWWPCFWAYGTVLLFSLVFNLGEKIALKRPEKVGVIALVVFASIAIILVFRGWTLDVDKRSDVILGVQGRYFLPFYNLILLCLSTPQASLVRKNCLLIYSTVIACIYAIDLVTLARFFA